jgi:hypothetical protein
LISRHSCFERQGLSYQKYSSLVVCFIAFCHGYNSEPLINSEQLIKFKYAKALNWHHLFWAV